MSVRRSYATSSLENSKIRTAGVLPLREGVTKPVHRHFHGALAFEVEAPDPSIVRPQNYPAPKEIVDYSRSNPCKNR